MADCFIGRQPIFNRNKEVYAYELLYRSSEINAAGDIDRDVATSQMVMNSFIEIGLENIVGHRLAFLNMTQQFLITPELMCFPPEQVVLEIPEDVEIDDNVVSAVKNLHDKGYTIALDGFQAGSAHERLLDSADVVKLDALGRDDQQLKADLAKLSSRDMLLMAKRVETEDRMFKLMDMGFDYFQGNFLSEVKIVSGKRLPTNKVAILQLLSKVSDPRADLEDMVNLISQDASLSLRVLRFVNSPLSGLMREVDSIHQAVILLGRDIIKNWVMLLTIANLDDTLPELITTAFVRARLCENLAKEAGCSGADSFFTVGLFSLVDAMMGLTMETLLEDLPFTDELKNALLENGGERGAALTCAQEMELGAPSGIKFAAVDPQRIADLYLEALQWADESVAAINSR